MMKILKIDYLYELHVAKAMYRNNVPKLPKPLKKFTSNTQLHYSNTRNRDNPLVQLPRLAIGQSTTAHMGPLI